MAAEFKLRYKKDVLTIDQAFSKYIHTEEPIDDARILEPATSSDSIKGCMDLQIHHPVPYYHEGRPNWAYRRPDRQALTFDLGALKIQRPFIVRGPTPDSLGYEHQH